MSQYLVGQSKVDWHEMIRKLENDPKVLNQIQVMGPVLLALRHFEWNLTS